MWNTVVFTSLWVATSVFVRNRKLLMKKRNENNPIIMHIYRQAPREMVVFPTQQFFSNYLPPLESMTVNNYTNTTITGVIRHIEWVDV